MKKNLLFIILAGAFPLVALLGCSNYLPPEQATITVADVQREIKIGMSSTKVVEALGSPNMITTDSERRETWIYDKISTSVSSSSEGNGILLSLAGLGGNINRSSSSQKTLTIIIKFSNNGMVRDFSYKTSSF
ncbi:MAG: outer membrane protein assembly factor BamE [Rickettsiales bacterium]|jgi:outer membrane protein assembly factor BamE (lipoprotein component of BamABCDE complex)|nr:outer membrane protein assembly factor BamE [Rickettsiales bacterium]